MSELRFIHSSDLHLGRRFSNFPEDIRGRLVEARHSAIKRLAAAARTHGAIHVLLAGDLFDSNTPSDPVLRQAIAAMNGAGDLQWWILPGNHDSLAAETLWDRVRAQSAANVRLLDTNTPVAMGEVATLLPAPLPRRFPGRDLTEWMPVGSTPEGRLRIGLAHGGVVSFGTEEDDAETIPPDRASSAGLDYLALGDWHGFRQVGDRTFYSGSPEQDRFKHAGPGACLAVSISGPGGLPQVARIPTGQFLWSEVSLPLTPAEDASAALASALLPGRHERRDTLLRVQASGWIRLPERSALVRSARESAPEFGFFELDDRELQTECSAEDLDEISPGGALREAADALRRDEEDDTASAEDRAVAAAALRRLYGYVTGHAA